MSTQPVYNHLYEPYQVAVAIDPSDDSQYQKTLSAALSIRMVSSGGYTYIGQSFPGTETSAPHWMIRRLTEADDTVLFAEGTGDFDKVWDDYLSFSYL